MDKVAGLLDFQWHAYWRRLQRAGNLTRNNVGVLVLLGTLGVLRYHQQLPFAGKQLSIGEASRYRFLLAVVFLLWMLAAIGESRRSISSRALLHFPLSVKSLYFVRLVSVFVSPFSWTVLMCSLVLVHPVSKAPSPFLGITALLLFLLVALLSSLIAADLLIIGWARWLLLVSLIGISAALIAQRLTGKSFVAPGQWLPNQLAANVAISSRPAVSLAWLGCLSIIALLVSFWTFAAGLHSQSWRRSQRLALLPSLSMVGKFSGLVRKDLRYSFRLLDLYLAVPIVVLFNVYVISNNAPSPFAFWIAANVVLLPFTSLAFNSFGLDNSLGLDRYSLFPLSSGETLVSKNLSFGFVALVLFGTMLPLGSWKFGPGASVQALMICVLEGLSYLSYGNWLSVNDPFKMQVYRFSSGGSAVDALMGVIIGSLPGALAIYWLYHDETGAWWKILALLILYVGIYLLSLKRSSRALERNWESLRASLQ